MALDVLNVTPETEDTSTDVGAPVKSAAPTKGGISPVGTTLLNPTQTAELLANMEKMIAQKTGPYAKLMGGVQDALAYATPQAGGQQALALQYRNQQKRQEMEDIFGMRQQMAALNASTQQAQAQREAMNQILGGGGTQQQRPAQTDTLGGGAPQQVDVFGGAEIPPEIRQAIAMDPVNGPAILQKYLTTAAGERNKAKLNPAWYELTEVVGTDGQIIKVPRIQAVELAMQNPSNPKNRAVIKSSSDLSTAAAAAPQLRPQGNAAQIAEGLGIPVVSGYRSPEKQQELYTASQQPGYSGPPVAKPGGSQHQKGNAIDVDSRKLTPEMRQKLVDNGFVQPLPKTDPNHWELAGAREKPIAPTQVAGPAQVTAGGPPRAMPGESVDSLKMRQKQWEEQLASELKVQTEGKSAYSGNVGKAEATAASGVDDAYTTAGDRLNRSTHSLSLVDDPGVAKMVGYLEKSGTSAAILRQIRDGITMGRLGDINLKDFDATLAKSGASQDEINKFNKLVNNLKADELTEARSLLKGQGQVSDSERKLVSSMVGNISNTADALKVAIKWRQERAQLDREMGEAFNKYRDTKGEYASFNAFMRTDGRRVIDAHNARLANILGVSQDQVAGLAPYDRNVTATSQKEAPANDVQSLVDKYKTKK